MYTVCWVDHKGHDRWERCRNRGEVENLLKREDIWDEDTVIFTPFAEEYMITGNEF